MCSGSRTKLMIAAAVLAIAAAARGQHDGVEPARDASARPVDFLREVRPILAESCYRCHGPDAATREAGLRLDRRLTGAERGAIVAPDSPDASVLLDRVKATDPLWRMPPEGERLTATQISILTRWISEGASWGEHWAFTQPVPRPLPQVRQELWPRNPIDRFILHRLEDRGIAPAAEASREAWLRRVTFDVTGLPPTPAEIDAFLADASDRARETVVDRLLASQRFGERQAQDWLDLARYADTNGYLYDEPRSAWKWREWVVDAFNQNVPYDRFAIEQLAGDLLPNATRSQRIATGFNRNHIISSEGGEEADESRSSYVIDRVNTTATAFLGLTLGCAQCHDHKFDPLTQKDYYRFYAFFNNVDEVSRNSSMSPMITVPGCDQEAAFDDLEAKVKTLTTRLEADDAAMDAGQRSWEQKTRERLDPPVRWRVAEPISMMAHRGTVLKQLPDGSVLATGETPIRDTFDLVLKPGPQKITAVRLEVLPHESQPEGGIGRGQGGRFIVTRLQMRVSTLSDARDPPLVYVARAECDVNQAQPKKPAQFDALPGGLEECVVAEDGASESAAIRALSYGWSIIGEEARNPHEAILLPADPLVLNDVSILSVKIEQAGSPYRTLVGRFRVSITDDERIRRLLLPVTPAIWSTVGPFPAEDLAAGFATPLEPESGIAGGLDLARTFKPPARARAASRPSESKPGPGAEGGGAANPPAPRSRTPRELAWEVKRWRDGRAAAVGAGSDAGTWFFTRKVESTAPRTATLRLTGPDGVKVWVNGKEVYARAPAAAGADSRPHAASEDEADDDGGAASRGPQRSDPDEVRFPLHEGSNELVLKVLYRGGQARRPIDSAEADPDDDGAASFGRRDRNHLFALEIIAEGEDVLSHEVATAVQAGNTATGRQRAAVRAFYREKIDPVGRTLAAELADLERELARMKRGMPTALVMKELDEPREAHVFIRGDFRKKGEGVSAEVPTVLPPMAKDLPKDRLGLARWLVAAENPLTARVLVNRVWQQYFGEGLLKTPDDFGIRGEAPLYRDLLDWLAVRFVESGWDQKALHRLIALSATYAQAAACSPELLDKDPSNQLLARGPRQRFSAEMVRDNALYVSGLLVEKLGGPSIRPFQPLGALQDVAGARNAGRRRTPGQDQYRRALYVFWKRAMPYPSMVTFDAAKRDVCTARRSSTTTPLQALVLLNDPVYVEAAKMLGQRMLKEGGNSDAERIAYGFRWCTSRRASEKESRLLEELLAAERATFKADVEGAKKLLGVGDAKVDPAIGPAELAAWTMVASALLNLDESIHRG